MSRHYFRKNNRNVVRESQGEDRRNGVFLLRSVGTRLRTKCPRFSTFVDLTGNCYLLVCFTPDICVSS